MAKGKRPFGVPVFKSENEEADWWTSPAGREFARLKSKELQQSGERLKGSPIVAKLSKRQSVQIALRLSESDLAAARRIAGEKGIGYQTLLKMLVHEGLRRESRRLAG